MAAMLKDQRVPSEHNHPVIYTTITRKHLNTDTHTNACSRAKPTTRNGPRNNETKVTSQHNTANFQEDFLFNFLF